MKVVLVQLPVPNNRLANLPLALGYLKAAADAAQMPGVTVELLDATAQNRGGDAFIADAILARSPDVVGFSLYTWNSSRVLLIARELKRLAPELLIIGGGPEVNRDGDFVLASHDFDIFVLGEGERTFVSILQTLSQGRAGREQLLSYPLRGTAVKATSYELRATSRANLPLTSNHQSSITNHQWLFGDAQTALDDVNDIPSAYLSGALDGQVGRFISIELSRWCPSKCTFCYYGRQDIPRGGKRYFDLARVRAEMRWAMERGVEQVHFVEANFNTLPHLDGLYSLIKEIGANRRMSFYAELRGEAITPEHAATLASCNFGTVEVGLQSAVPEVMALVRRKNKLPRLVAGVHNLRNEGIEVFLDVILGLPGETPQTFRRTLDFMDAQDLRPYDLFNLQILSGTELKTQALGEKHGLKWQSAPPYFVLETDKLSFGQLTDLRREAYARISPELDPAAVPGHNPPSPYALGDFMELESTEGDTPIENLVLDMSGRAPNPVFLPEASRRLASEVNVWLKLDYDSYADPDAVYETLEVLSKPNPSAVWNIFLDSQQPLDFDRVRQAIQHEEGYLDRLAVFARATPEIDRANFPSVRIYQLLPFYGHLVDKAAPNVIWRILLEPHETAAQWRATLEKALATSCAGLNIRTVRGTSPAKLKAALADLDTGGRQIWLSDPLLAAGLSYAAAEDASATAQALDYPLTAWLTGWHITYHRPARDALLNSALRWARE
jgi:radical SAM superfamily enzyme YgiQ (UPF0313 family)